jgi:biopolymer transport protein ExbB/TolQ
MTTRFDTMPDLDPFYTLAAVDLSPVLEMAAVAIYVAMGSIALYGVFCIILLARRIAQKRFASSQAAEHFLEEVRDHLQRQNYDGVVELCDSPPYWSKAVPQLVLVAIANRNLTGNKIRRRLAEKFETDVLADLEYRTSWVATIVKSAPMLGLLGTVVGMINAFAGIAEIQDMGGVSKELAGDISFALFTTAIGLSIAIPLVMAGNMVQVRIGKLQDAVQQHVGLFLEDLDSAGLQSGERQS